MKNCTLKRRMVVFTIIILPLSIFISNNRVLSITPQDKTYLSLFLEQWHISQTTAQVHQNFESEFNFISLVQDSVLAQVRGEQIPHLFFGNISYYYTTHRGICYDKAALMEKIFDLYHFPYRHIYLYFGKDGGSATLGNFFERGTTSHALLEVKTQKGWMVVDTYSGLLGLTPQGETFTITQLRQRLQDGSLTLKKVHPGKTIFEQYGIQFRYVYGLYSRHGDFFNQPRATKVATFIPSVHFLPDYNINMLLYNLCN